MSYQINNILYATDLGHHGPEVFRHAIDLAAALKAKLHVIHAMEPLTDYAEAILADSIFLTYTSEEMQTKFRDGGLEKARQEMKKRAEKICTDSGLTRKELEEMIGEVQVAEGVAHKAILEAAQRLNADVIIMGSHGKTVISEMLLGSVAHKVVIKSKVPVLLVPIKPD